jgi:SPP1 gp7 family putative phage head morphogenesis protein
MKRSRNKAVTPVRRTGQNLAASGSQKEATKRFLPYVKKAIAVTRKDIADWKRALALAQAEDPRNWMLQNLFEDVKNDALLTSQMNNRFQQTLSMGFTLKNPDGSVNEEQTEILKKHPLTRLLNKAKLESLTDGYNLVELSFKRNLNGDLILEGEVLPRTNVVPQKGLFYPDYSEDKAIAYRELPEYGTYILEYNSGSLGLVNKAVSHIIFRRFAQSCWAEFCEIFGIPPRVIKTNTQDPVMLKRAEDMLSDMGAASWNVIDTTEEFSWANGVSTKGEVYESLMTVCGNEICLLLTGAIIGQDTKNGNRSKEESNQELLWYLVQDDMAGLEETWNNINIPALVRLGILKGELSFEFDEAEDITQLWKMVNDSFQYFEYDPAWLKEKFGIEPTARREAVQQDEKEKKKDSEKLQMLFELFLAASAETTEATFKQKAKICCSGHHIDLALPKSDFDTDAYLKRVWDAGGTLTFDTGLFAYTSQTLIEGVKKGHRTGAKAELSNIGFTYGLDDPALLTAYEMNLFRFAGAKTLAEAKKLNELFRIAKNFEGFYQAASRVTEIFNKEYLQTEYQTAMLTGESAATYSRLMAQAETFPYWEYKTVGDNKVRPEHQALEGLILPFNDPIWKVLFPPNGWNCRCYIVPRMKHEVKDVDFAEMRQRVADYYQTEEFKKSDAQGWGVNRAVTGEVFSANQQYVTKFPGKASKSLEEIGAAQYNLPSYSNAKKVATEELPKYEGTAQEFFDKLEIAENKPVVRDYNNRPIVVTAKGFKTHSTGKRAYRVEYLNGMLETLKKPDEVWINNYQGDAFEDMINIKYYKDVTQIVVTKILNGKVTTLSTWFPLAEKKNVINNYRRGLLIFSK